MIYRQMELHNVEELVPVEGRPGLLLQRVPESVRAGLGELGSQQIRRAAAVEIRFCAPAGSDSSVTLASYGGTSTVQVYYGDYWLEDHELGEEPKRIAVKEPEPGFQFQYPWKEQVPRLSYGPVWRLVLQGFEVHLLDRSGEGLRPPEAKEKPALTYLAYGTSITFGISAATPDMTYVGQTAWRLGLDTINLGMPGSAYCETAIAEHIAGRNDWDIASLCISVNMLNQGVTVREFAEKAEAMVRRIASAHPSKPLVCISLFPSFADLGWTWPGRDVQASSEEYRRTLKRIAEGSGYPNVHYADGRELLDDWRGLSHDLLHPGNAGMIRIGERLARFMRPLVGE
ncbi:GDSL-type esterase/lipase family protein [Cohnella hongkongensis]|uniref:GDSL-type esterase/lipase family protein n=1 Tax=Cohnella hongkongensis TaxID=178337 RepID=A0ABV9F776_9BACL